MFVDKPTITSQTRTIQLICSCKCMPTSIKTNVIAFIVRYTDKVYTELSEDKESAKGWGQAMGILGEWWEERGEKLRTKWGEDDTKKTTNWMIYRSYDC